MTTDSPTRLAMLDSGAFSVWTQGAEIDLSAYINFCEKHPDVSYYVNLDVIPGKPGHKASLTKEAVQASCEAGWRNYQRMIAVLPPEKVIPVFHQGDHLRWLEKYLNSGVRYIGISPANDRVTSSANHKAAFTDRGAVTTKLQWLRSLIPHFAGSGVWTHGFAVTSYDLMKCDGWKWHSVDSASWKLAGAWGGIYVPAPDFASTPEIVRVSGTIRTESFGKLRTKIGEVRMPNRVREWLTECDVPVGSFRVESRAKLNREADEIWFNKARGIALVPEEKGVLTSVEERLRVNAEFIKRASKALKDYVRHIYFAGALMPYPLEYDLGKRLLSFEHTKGKSGSKCLARHEELIRQHQERRRAGK